MSLDPKALAALQAANREKGVDQSETSAGGDYTREVPVEGACFLRLISYVELGQHAEEFEGQKKTPNKVLLQFEVRGKNYPATNEETGRDRPFIISITMTLSNSDRANFHKLFNQMRGGNEEVKHMLDMIGWGFVGRIYHNVKGEGKDKKTYANLNSKAEGYSIKPAFKVETDVEAGTETRAPYTVPEAITPLRAFLWDFADKAQWDSLFIDGENKPKEGEEAAKSKNWIQDLIRKALNFKGSPIHAILNGAGELELDEPERPARSGQTDEDALAEQFGGGKSAPKESYDLNDDIPF